MVSTISFIQANLQHSIAASGILTRTVGIKGVDVALIQEPWYREGCVSGLSIPGYTLYSGGGKERPRACILIRTMDIWMLPRFSCRDLVAVLVKYNEEGVERRLVVCSAYLPYYSEDPPPSKELKELVRYCENEGIQLLVGCDSNAHHTACGSTNCNGRGEDLIEFLNSTNLEIFNRGNEPTFCTSVRQEVIDITLGSHGLLDSIMDWEVSLEPSLSDHEHILFTLWGSVPVLLTRNPRGTNWGSFREDLRERLEGGPEMNMRDEAGLSGSVYAQGYADDICLLAVGKFPNMVSRIMQMALGIIEKWCSEVGLSVNPDKTGLVAFMRRRKLTGFFEPRFFGRILQHSGSVKYLGVILDSRLTWREHVDVRVRKAQNSLWACRRACSGTWGLGPRVVHWLYVSVIRPFVTFASLVWWPGCQTARAKAKLSRIQRLACLGITGAVRNTPTCAMEALICLPPLELVVQSEAGWLRIASGIWDAGHTCIPIGDTVVF
jgi:hypothetical protein